MIGTTKRERESGEGVWLDPTVCIQYMVYIAHECSVQKPRHQREDGVSEEQDRSSRETA